MSNEEMIAEARAIAAHSAVSLPEHADYLTRLADALEDAEARAKELETGEWEYRCIKAAEWTGGMSVILRRAHYHADCPRRGFRTERRTTAGPWVPVESEDE